MASNSDFGDRVGIPMNPGHALFTRVVLVL